MSEWTPKVGDKVMVGEWGPYEVEHQSLPGGAADIRNERGHRWCVDPIWLTPAPEPEPDEPTAPGALVRDGAGNLLFRSTGDASRWYEVMTPGGGYWEWDEITRPITVVLANPVEVEQLRAEVGVLRKKVDRLQAECDEAKEAASHATVNADRFASQADTLRARLKMALRDRDLERRLGGEEKRRADEEKRRADELQRRIDRFMDAANGVPDINYLRLILRGES